MFKFAITATILLAVSAPASAQIIFVDDLSKFTPTKADQFRSDWDKLQCRAEDEVGTRLGRHQVCMTKWQWWTYEQETKEWIASMERLGSGSH